MEFDSLAGLAQHLLKQAASGLEAVDSGMEKATALLQKAAKAEFGVYQDAAGPFPAWADLADSTKEDRVRQGYSENDPLLRSGDLRDSIEREVVHEDGINHEGIVGSTSDIMPFHEFGTVKMPPRPVLGPALIRNAEKVARLIANPLVGHYASSARVGYAGSDYGAQDFDNATDVHSSLGYNLTRGG